ncbi:MAG: T9SS type A sorting domain-containing protein, partial [Ignavibacteriaceae bacterium]
GDVTVTRVSGSAGAVTIGGKTGINRKWVITTITTPSSAKTLTLSWVSDDDNGSTLSNMRVWKSDDGGTTYSDISGSDQNASSRAISVSVSSFSTFTVSDNSNALPVELYSFAANSKSNEVELNWTTATEVKNYGFEVERIRNEELGIRNWEKVGFVQGHGNSNSPNEYSFTDKPLGGSEFKYRLKQIDFDGKYEYSKEVEIDLGMPTKFSLEQNYPNPFNPSTVIRYTLPFESNVKLIVYNFIGEVVKELVNETVSSGYQEVRFEAGKLSSGIYFYILYTTSLDGKQNYQSVKKMALIK